MRRLIFPLLAILVGLVIGGLWAQNSLQRAQAVGGINVGIWSAWPFISGRQVNPYTDARATIEGTIPLGAGEGLAFETSRDGSGQNLTRNCQYVLSGTTPISRFWTLIAYDLTGNVLEDENKRPIALISTDLIRGENNAVLVTLGQNPVSGNWLRLSGSGNFKLVLRLYDTTITSSTGLLAPELPTLQRKDCA